MPGHNGTGPAGAGPMTGKGKGYCIIELPENKDMPRIVSEALTEIQETQSPDSTGTETAHLHYRAMQIQTAINDLNNRIDILKRDIIRNAQSKILSPGQRY